MLETEITRFLKAIRDGATIAEAARRSGIPEATARSAYQRGEKTGPRSKSLKFRESVKKAQAEWEQRVGAIFRKQAKEGSAKALDLLDQRTKEQAEDLRATEEPPTDPLDLARWLLAHVLRRLPNADGIAFNQLIAARGTLTREIADLEMKEKQKAQEAANLRAVKNTEAAARLRARLAKMGEKDPGALLDLQAALAIVMKERGIA